MYEKERIYRITQIILKNRRQYTHFTIKGKWLNDLGFTAGKRVLVRTIKENDVFKFNISLMD